MADAVRREHRRNFCQLNSSEASSALHMNRSLPTWRKESVLNVSDYDEHMEEGFVLISGNANSSFEAISEAPSSAESTPLALRRQGRSEGVPGRHVQGQGEHDTCFLGRDRHPRSPAGHNNHCNVRQCVGPYVGCKSFSPGLRDVTWPEKFKPGSMENFNGTQNP